MRREEGQLPPGSLRRISSVLSLFPADPGTPAVVPSTYRLVRGLYPLLDAPDAPGGRLVSPFRLPAEIERGLWEPFRPPPVVRGTPPDVTAPGTSG